MLSELMPYRMTCCGARSGAVLSVPRCFVPRCSRWFHRYHRYLWPLLVGVLLFTGLGGSRTARGNTLLFDEQLADGSCDSNACYATSGGQYVTDGWQVTVPVSQMVLELAPPSSAGIPCGSVTVEFTNFDPVANMKGCQSNSTECSSFFIALYEEDHGNMHQANNQDQSQLMVLASCEHKLEPPDPGDYWRDERLCYKGLACSWTNSICEMSPPWQFAPPQSGTGIVWANTMDYHYTVTITWDCEGVTRTLSDDHGNSWSYDATWGWHAGHPDPRPHFRYLFLGQDNSTGFGNKRVIYTVFVSAAAEEHDSACNCTTNTPPAITGIGVFAPDNTRHDQGGPAAIAGDTVLLRGGLQDAESADEEMQSCRFSVRTHGAGFWNVFEDVAATFSAFAPHPELNWMAPWDIPSDATEGFYDVRFSCTDQGGLSATQTQNNEFEVVAPVTPDAGVDGNTVIEDDAVVDCAADSGEDSTVDAAVGPTTDSGIPTDSGSGGKNQSAGIRGGCGCALGARGRVPGGSSPGLPAGLLLVLCATLMMLKLTNRCLRKQRQG